MSGFDPPWWADSGSDAASQHVEHHLSVGDRIWLADTHNVPEKACWVSFRWARRPRLTVTRG